MLLVVALAGTVPQAVVIPQGDAVAAQGEAQLSAVQVFALADDARLRKEFATAEAAYHALAQDRDPEVRIEARFRLAMMLTDDLGRHGDAALLFRRILDERPAAARVRLELARVQALLGNNSAARRELRAAQATGLPPAVAQMVQFYAQALNARKPFGGSIEVAIAPDSNINRATRSETLGTILGDFSLTDDARAKSGVGLDVQGQVHGRIPLSAGLEWTTRASTDARLYRYGDFNDVAVSIQTGPQFRWGNSQITLSAGPSWRWYGNAPFSRSFGGGVNWQKPLGKRGQVRMDGTVASVINKRNALQSGESYALSMGIDRAFGARTGGGLQIFGQREATRDAGYALTTGGASFYAYREVGRTTLVGNVGYSHLEADKRIFLYPRRRIDDRFSASVSATLRALHVGSFAPLVRLRWERNRSTVELYAFRRVAAEFGVTSAF